MSRPLHIAILECDIPVDAVKARRGTYGDIFHELLVGALRALGKANGEVQLRTTNWDVVQAGRYPDLQQEHIDAIRITGSKHTAFHDDPWILTLMAYVQRIFQNPNIILIGICFGHQIIARALGAQVGLNPEGWEISASDIELSEHGRKLFGTSSIVLHQMHRDAVLSLPEGAVNLGSSNRCDIQGMFIPGRAISVQAHPEFDRFIMDNIVKTRQAQKVFDDNMAKEGLERSVRQQHGVQVCVSILQHVLSII